MNFTSKTFLAFLVRQGIKNVRHQDGGISIKMPDCFFKTRYILRQLFFSNLPYIMLRSSMPNLRSSRS